jgi:hypothetical protein
MEVATESAPITKSNAIPTTKPYRLENAENPEVIEKIRNVINNQFQLELSFRDKEVRLIEERISQMEDIIEQISTYTHTTKKKYTKKEAATDLFAQMADGTFVK